MSRVRHFSADLKFTEVQHEINVAVTSLIVLDQEGTELLNGRVPSIFRNS